jgi:hypothetical protein
MKNKVNKKDLLQTKSTPEKRQRTWRTNVMQTKATPETGKEQREQKNLMQARSTPETDKEKGGKKGFYANQINT